MGRGGDGQEGSVSSEKQCALFARFVFLLDIFQKRPLEFGLSAAGELDEGREGGRESDAVLMCYILSCFKLCFPSFNCSEVRGAV